MPDFLQWALGQISVGSISAVGGNGLVLGLIPVFITSLLLWKAQATLPVSALIIFAELGILGITMNNPGDILFGGSTDVGAIYALYLLVVAMTGFLIYHFVFKRTQMG